MHFVGLYASAVLLLQHFSPLAPNDHLRAYLPALLCGRNEKRVPEIGSSDRRTVETTAVSQGRGCTMASRREQRSGRHVQVEICRPGSASRHRRTQVMANL